ASERAALFRSHDVFAYSSAVPEPFGFLHLEAMASGTCVVTTDEGGIAEAVKDGENALVVQPGRANQLANRISRLVNEPEKAEGLARQARAHVEQAFSLERYGAELEACIADAVAAGR
ncbi:MAG: glycosyltransferase family 4 protein, partial [Candidatus Hydrogenedentes bacterium]|nr:glycosyltransferase family 4 protein [Candidatus Hydrogenedentota bacterium]